MEFGESEHRKLFENPYAYEAWRWMNSGKEFAVRRAEELGTPGDLACIHQWVRVEYMKEHGFQNPQLVAVVQDAWTRLPKEQCIPLPRGADPLQIIDRMLELFVKEPISVAEALMKVPL